MDLTDFSFCLQCFFSRDTYPNIGFCCTPSFYGYDNITLFLYLCTTWYLQDLRNFIGENLDAFIGRGTKSEDLNFDPKSL